jgi:hypothetical protein
VSVINLDECIAKRREFSTDEWVDILTNSCGLDPEKMTRRQKLLYLCGCIPLVETNVNMVELAPRETGFTPISPAGKSRNLPQTAMRKTMGSFMAAEHFFAAGRHWGRPGHGHRLTGFSYFLIAADVTSSKSVIREARNLDTADAPFGLP